MQGLFTNPQAVTVEEKRSGTVKQFKGNGTAFLKAPGLKSISHIRVGMLDMPLLEVRRYPANDNFEEKISQTRPLVMVETDENGVSTVMRSAESNDGIWQDGVQIWIWGEWEEKSAPATKPSAPATTGATA